MGCDGIIPKAVIFLAPRYNPSIDGISGVRESPQFVATGFSNTASPEIFDV